MSSCAGVGIRLLGRYVPPLLICVRLRSLFTPSVRCRPCISLWSNTGLNIGLCLAFFQGLPHLIPVGPAPGQRVTFCCYRTARCLQVFREASFYVTAGLSRAFYTRQASSEPPAAGPAGPDIRLLKPQLQKQWHHANNQHLGNIKVKPSSHLRVSWTCDQCPRGLHHEWLTTVCHRQGMDTQCPFCTNNKLCHHNSLATVAPSVAAYWDTVKNGVTADRVMARSHTRSHWLCPTCCHSWQAPVHNKTRTNSGCPKCSNRSKGHTRRPTLTSSNHPVMLEFDHSRNQKAGLNPDKITLGSNKKVHWICCNCPGGHPHLWMAPPSSRTRCNSGCPCCSSKLACNCNSLQSLYPALAAEWGTARNGAGPDQILPGSHKLGHWKNSAGRSWEQSPHDRAYVLYQAAKRALIKAHNKTLQA